jgi:hypothetical protein
MSKMSDLQISIQEDIQAGRLSFAEIAAKYEVPFDWVDAAAGEVADYDDGIELTDYDDSMDGDFDSAMASAGYGTDEDYGCYGADDY